MAKDFNRIALLLVSGIEISVIFVPDIEAVVGAITPTFLEELTTHPLLTELSLLRPQPVISLKQS